MGLHGKLVAAVEFRAGGDVYHEIFKYNPQNIPTYTKRIQRCDLHEGEFGKVGSIISWTYTHADGIQRFAKEEILELDDEKKKIVLKVLEGDLMEEYKDFLVILHVETKDGIDLVTWTLEYETLDDEVDAPIELLKYFIHFTKDIEAHHLN